MGAPYSGRIIEYVDLALKALEIVYRTNRAAVEGLADRNGHIQKVVGEGKSVSWGGAWREPTRRRGICTSVSLHQSKSLEDSRIIGNRKWEHILQQG